jgi:hypothetical protein
MLYKNIVLKDNPIGFWTLDESSGSIAYDYSGAQNHASYNFTPVNRYLPLVPGGVLGTKISGTDKITLSDLKSPYGNYIQGALADKYSSDVSFTLECWVQINECTSATIFADETNSIGIYWQNNSIVFSIGTSNKIHYLVKDKYKSLHIVGVYTNNYMSLYVDGQLIDTNDMSDFVFTNSTFRPQVGTVVGGADAYMIIDAPAVYRYELSSHSITTHYSMANIPSYVSISDPENGKCFSNIDGTSLLSLKYEYGYNRDIQLLQNDSLYYNPSNKTISIFKTDTPESITTEVIDIISIPIMLDFVSSKIEWSTDNGVSIYTSSTGETNSYVECQNGFPIPQYQYNSLDASNLIYLKVVYSTADSSKYTPVLDKLNITLYGTLEVTSSNSVATISSSSNISIGSESSPAIARNKRSGIRTGGNNSFTISDTEETKTIEMIYTPETINAASLVSRGSNFISWNQAGTITKSGFDSLYINGSLVSWSSNIWTYLTKNQPSHIVAIFTSPSSDNLVFNNQGIAAKYEGISLYPSSIAISPSAHYAMHIGSYYENISNESITVTEIGTPIYDYDFVVVKTV